MTDFTVRTTSQLPGLLNAFRKTAGLTQRDVAQRLGVTQHTVSAMERNAEAVSAERLMKLLAILGVDLILRVRPEPPPESPAGPDSPDRADW